MNTVKQSPPALDAQHMDHALTLAEKGLYTTDPNPRVGCVIARGEEVVGTGFHRAAGSDHAEVVALREAGALSRNATAYVTLEPCSHYGRTPPCAEALVHAGVDRVVIATLDPFEQVNGQGVDTLRSHGITVDVGVQQQAAQELNRGYFSRLRRGRPWVRLKLAMSLDGRTALANGESQWITGPQAREDVHRLRAQSSAILSGIDSVIADGARLNARLDSQAIQQPTRVILDSQFRLPANAPCVDVEAPLLVVGTATPPAWMAERGIEVIRAEPDPAGRPSLVAVLKMLGGREINELHVEAGATLSAALIEARLVDELVVYVAPDLLGPDARPLVSLPPLARLADKVEFQFDSWVPVGRDLRVTLLPRVQEK